MLEQGSPPFFILGGSNILLTKDIAGTVLKNKSKGLRSLRKHQRTRSRVCGGEVKMTLFNGALNRISVGWKTYPSFRSSVGAAPMQNIALRCRIAVGIRRLELCPLMVFHNGHSTMRSVALLPYVRLKEELEPVHHYVGLLAIVQATGLQHFLWRNRGRVGQVGTFAVVESCQCGRDQHSSTKLPDPNQIGNSGSFFKNPVISTDLYQQLQQKYPDIVGYTVSETEVKVAAGWLIDRAGWKGHRRGDAESMAPRAGVGQLWKCDRRGIETFVSRCTTVGAGDLWHCPGK